MDRSNEFDLLLKLYRQSLSVSKRNKTSNPESPFFNYPAATEHLYATQVSTFMKKFVGITREKLNLYMKKWLKQDNMDGVTSDFSTFKQEMEEEFLTLYMAAFALNSPSYVLLNEISEKVYLNAVTQWQKQLFPVLGFTWSVDKSTWPDIKNFWIQNNQIIMQKQGKEFISSTEVLIITALQSFWEYPQFIESFDVIANKFTGYRSELLARNEVGILNTHILKGLYEEVGMPYYVWHTAMDERVRGNPTGRYPKAIPSHWIMEGLLVKWNDATVYSDDLGRTWKKKTGRMEPYQAGIAINCRCVPQPFWGDKIKKVDSSIGEPI